MNNNNKKNNYGDACGPGYPLQSSLRYDLRFYPYRMRAASLQCLRRRLRRAVFIGYCPSKHQNKTKQRWKTSQVRQNKAQRNNDMTKSLARYLLLYMYCQYWQILKQINNVTKNKNGCRMQESIRHPRQRITLPDYSPQRKEGSY